MTTENYMALADIQSLWDNDMKPHIQQTYSTKSEHQTKVVEVSASATKTESPTAGAEIDVIYVNTASSAVTVTIAASSTVKTPTGSNITITIPVGGYGEASFANIGGTIYARGV